MEISREASTSWSSNGVQNSCMCESQAGMLHDADHKEAGCAVLPTTPPVTSSPSVSNHLSPAAGDKVLAIVACWKRLLTPWSSLGRGRKEQSLSSYSPGYAQRNPPQTSHSMFRILLIWKANKVSQASRVACVKLVKGERTKNLPLGG